MTTMTMTTKTPKANNFFVSCVAHDGKIVNGNWVRTRARTKAGLWRAAVLQVWSASPAALCGYRLKEIIVEPAWVDDDCPVSGKTRITDPQADEDEDEEEGYEEPDEVLFTSIFGYALAVYRNGQRVAFVPRLLTRDSEERRIVLRGDQVSLESFSSQRGWEEIEVLGSMDELTRNQGYYANGSLHDWEPNLPGDAPLSSVRELS